MVFELVSAPRLGAVPRGWIRRAAVEVVTRTIELERTVVKEVPVPTAPTGAVWADALS